MKDKIPEYCDFDRPFADFPPADTADLCRTMSGVWCKKLKELTNKNTPCEWRKRQEIKSRVPRPKRKKRTR
ncbi:MAG: hypothetical protein ACE5I3_04420 [Phycisphaerae bacterium]